MVSKRFVIAKYKENIDWTKELEKPDQEVCIYNKDNTGLTKYRDYEKQKDNWINLCNIGRESHTYLMHIVHHYHDLRDVEIFLQGRIDDHVSCSSLQQLFQGCEERLFQSYGHITKICCFNEKTYEDTKKALPNHPHVDRGYPPEGTREYIFFRELYPTLPYPGEPYAFRAFGLFSVRKELIQAYPKEFYEMLLEYFNPEAENFMGMEPNDFIANIGYTFEIFWQMIFTMPLRNNISNVQE